MKEAGFPLPAIVGQDALKAALLLNAVDPAIGGVLIRGHKGTGKSTAARALGSLLPAIEVLEGCPFNSSPAAPFLLDGLPPGGAAVHRPTPFVELPLNTTEDRLVGTLHLEKALATGRRQFEPGLLAAANRGILYVDEVNLLDDHLVDMLLDAAASGRNCVEREGISLSHPARFMLVGTMNPEEGELRPQFLDRFGLCVTVEQITDLEARQEILRRRLAYEADPALYATLWDTDCQLYAEQIRTARQNLAATRWDDQFLEWTVRLCRGLAVQGHRADITLLKTARAHAAFLEKSELDQDDLAEAARLALPHRMQASPLASPLLMREQLDRALKQLFTGSADPEEADSGEPSEDLEELAQTMQIPGACAAGSIVLAFLKKKSLKRPSSPISK